MIKQIGLPLRGRPILLITRLITDRIGLHSVLLPLHIAVILLNSIYSVIYNIKSLYNVKILFAPVNLYI